MAEKALRAMLNKALKIEVEIDSLTRTQRNWVTVALTGKDEVIAQRYLENLWGKVCDIGELEENQLRRGKIVDLGKVGYGIYVDIGVVNGEGEPIDALIPIHQLRKQLGVKGSLSVNQISKHLGLMDNFPLDIRITGINMENGEIEGKLTNSQAREIGRGKHRFYVCGETRRKIKNAIDRTGNSGNIVRIRRLGLLENEVQCPKQVDPHDIIRDIGPVVNADMAVCRGL